MAFNNPIIQDIVQRNADQYESIAQMNSFDQTVIDRFVDTVIQNKALNKYIQIQKYVLSLFSKTSEWCQMINKEPLVPHFVNLIGFSTSFGPTKPGGSKPPFTTLDCIFMTLVMETYQGLTEPESILENAKYYGLFYYLKVKESELHDIMESYQSLSKITNDIIRDICNKETIDIASFMRDIYTVYTNVLESARQGQDAATLTYMGFHVIDNLIVMEGTPFLSHYSLPEYEELVNRRAIKDYIRWTTGITEAGLGKTGMFSRVKELMNFVDTKAILRDSIQGPQQGYLDYEKFSSYWVSSHGSLTKQTFTVPRNTCIVFLTPGASFGLVNIFEQRLISLLQDSKATDFIRVNVWKQLVYLLSIGELRDIETLKHSVIYDQYTICPDLNISFEEGSYINDNKVNNKSIGANGVYTIPIRYEPDAIYTDKYVMTDDVLKDGDNRPYVSSLSTVQRSFIEGFTKWEQGNKEIQGYRACLLSDIVNTMLSGKTNNNKLILIISACRSRSSHKNTGESFSCLLLDKKASNLMQVLRQNNNREQINIYRREIENGVISIYKKLHTTYPSLRTIITPYNFTEYLGGSRFSSPIQASNIDKLRINNSITVSNSDKRQVYESEHFYESYTESDKDIKGPITYYLNNSILILIRLLKDFDVEDSSSENLFEYLISSIRNNTAVFNDYLVNNKDIVSNMIPTIYCNVPRNVWLLWNDYIQSKILRRTNLCIYSFIRYGMHQTVFGNTIPDNLFLREWISIYNECLAKFDTIYDTSEKQRISNMTDFSEIVSETRDYYNSIYTYIPSTTIDKGRLIYAIYITILLYYNMFSDKMNFAVPPDLKNAQI